jgi:hypothetical protein
MVTIGETQNSNIDRQRWGLRLASIAGLIPFFALAVLPTSDCKYAPIQVILIHT